MPTTTLFYEEVFPICSPGYQRGQLVRPVETVLRTEARFCLLERSDAPSNRRGVRAFRERLLDTIPKEVGDLGLT